MDMELFKLATTFFNWLFSIEMFLFIDLKWENVWLSLASWPIALSRSLVIFDICSSMKSNVSVLLSLPISDSELFSFNSLSRINWTHTRERDRQGVKGLERERVTESLFVRVCLELPLNLSVTWILVLPFVLLPHNKQTNNRSTDRHREEQTVADGQRKSDPILRDLRQRAILTVSVG